MKKRIVFLIALILLLGGVPIFGANPISNQATVDYDDAGGNSQPQELSDGDTSTGGIQTTDTDFTEVIVANSSSGTVTAGTAAPQCNDYTHIITNDGSVAETFNLTVSESNASSWASTIYSDPNGDGDPSDGVIITVVYLTPGETYAIVIHTCTTDIIPDGDVGDTTTLTATGQNYGATDSNVDITTPSVAAPLITVTKTVSNAGPVLVGTTLTYTIKVCNAAGAGVAKNIVVVDPIPANTTYVAASMTLEAGALTDAADADAGDYNITNAGSITVNINEIQPGTCKTITFQVVVQ